MKRKIGKRKKGTKECNEKIRNKIMQMKVRFKEKEKYTRTDVENKKKRREEKK